MFILVKSTIPSLEPEELWLNGDLWNDLGTDSSLRKGPAISTLELYVAQRTPMTKTIWLASLGFQKEHTCGWVETSTWETLTGMATV